jgi:uncharacterized surface protein with fasciclin (FAS1) repeats
MTTLKQANSLGGLSILVGAMSASFVIVSPVGAQMETPKVPTAAPKVQTVPTVPKTPTAVPQVPTAPGGMQMLKTTEMEPKVSPETKSIDSKGTSAKVGTVAEIAASDASFKILASALKESGLDKTLAGEGPFTVFAPTDQAFEALPKGALEQLTKPENKAILTKVLTYHVVPGKVTSGTLASGPVKTVEGGSVNVKVDSTSKSVMVNDAKVVKADVEASNGVIHVIDKVILPPDLTGAK